MRAKTSIGLLAAGLGLLLLTLVAVSLIQGRSSETVARYEAHPAATEQNGAVR